MELRYAGGMSTANQGLAELENWEILRSFLPPEWAEQARRLGAMRRARYISDPETVLRVLLLHLATGCSWRRRRHGLRPRVWRRSVR